VYGTILGSARRIDRQDTARECDFLSRAARPLHLVGDTTRMPRSTHLRSQRRSLTQLHLRSPYGDPDWSEARNLWCQLWSRVRERRAFEFLRPVDRRRREPRRWPPVPWRTPVDTEVRRSSGTRGC